MDLCCYTVLSRNPYKALLQETQFSPSTCKTSPDWWPQLAASPGLEGEADSQAWDNVAWWRHLLMTLRPGTIPGVQWEVHVSWWGSPSSLPVRSSIEGTVLKDSLFFVPAMGINFRTTLGQISENKSYNGTSYLSWEKKSLWLYTASWTPLDCGWEELHRCSFVAKCHLLTCNYKPFLEVFFTKTNKELKK